ncbi:putative muconate cycloisomerase [Flavihumibacter petaseus NBRC 106054]|uniref:Dipeptide epimerase n=2 Tax=Flavihumibacter TaxID=1004301 RepID=A0A0E9MYZ7_9BACT|nr:putative muconate cycloisomerase [Flavihumibacter petaseus NBRC 106054]
MHFAQNTFIRVHTDSGWYGVGECSAFPMIVGETQDTCQVMAADFAKLWKGKDALDIPSRLRELDAFTAGNNTIKSAFDMALYDIAAKAAGQPLYRFLGGTALKPLLTDLTIGIGTPGDMAEQARDFVRRGVTIIKIKLGKDPETDMERVRHIREVVGPEIRLRIDANQGWSPEEALQALMGMGPYHIQFCEQPMRSYNDHFLPGLKQLSPIPVMADESVFHHQDAARLIRADACDSVNIKLSKSGGIQEALLINQVCSAAGIPCMMGGMLESRLALSAFAHLATALDNIIYYDMDTCLLGHLEDPVTGGVTYDGFYVVLPDAPGIGADISEAFLQQCDRVTV